MINIPKGTKDVLPQDSYKWHYVENAARETAEIFNLKEIRTPVFEHTELFARGVGDTTDIVNKEMYTFEDKGGRSITLKPEGTAGVARSFIENSLGSGVLPVKMYYFTPVFRYERPQAGRLREHHQFGIELYGGKGADMDAETILIADYFLKKLGIDRLELNINSIGCKSCRPAYNSALKDYFKPHAEQMCPVCRDRLERNPLRVLDCKEDKCREVIAGAPVITDYLCPECSAHFENLKMLLSAAGLEYKVNPMIVRGLDYYSKTVFEFVSTAIGSQGTVCGGGRYDTLVENIGGSPMPCVGFGLGLERLLLLMENCGIEIPSGEGVKIYIAPVGEKAYGACFELLSKLRRAGVKAEIDHMRRSVKAQFKYADKLGAEYVAAVGENEIECGKITVKKMSDGSSFEIALSEAADYMKSL